MLKTLLGRGNGGAGGSRTPVQNGRLKTSTSVGQDWGSTRSGPGLAKNRVQAFNLARGMGGTAE